MTNKTFLLTLIFIYFRIICSQADNQKFCTTSNDADRNILIRGFTDDYVWNKNENFNDLEKDFLLYNHTSITVISKYRQCGTSINCNCAIVLRVENEEKTKYAFLDICHKDFRIDWAKNEVEFEYKEESDESTIYSKLNCPKFESNWSDVPVSFDWFQCAKLDSDKYMIRTMLNGKMIINVNVMFSLVISDEGEDEIKEVSISHDENFNELILESGGLCGPLNPVNSTVMLPSNSGYLINVQDLEIDWNFNLKENLVKSCDVANNGDYVYTFTGKRLQKTEAFQKDKNYILYQDDELIRITGKFQNCNKDGSSKHPLLCNCALTIEATDAIHPRYVFVDACNANVDINKQFKYYDRTEKSSLQTGEFPLMNCDEDVISNMNDESQWSKLKKKFNYFKCARLDAPDNLLPSASTCQTYLVEADISNKNIRLKVDMTCEGENDPYLSNIQLIPSKRINKHTGGLCGRVDLDNPLCSLSLKPDEDDCQEKVENLANHWNLENEELEVKWELDLTSFTNLHNCNFYNYEKTILLLNNEGFVKTKRIYDVFSPMVLYNHNQEVMVMSRFKYCVHTTRTQFCACSLYIRVNNTHPHFAFIDVCNIKDILAANSDPSLLKFKYFNNPNVTFYPELNCNYTIKDELSEEEWKNVTVSFDHFKCVKLQSECTKYIIRTVNTGHNIQVLADVSCQNNEMDVLSEINIKPAFKGENNTNGLCGFWNRKSSANSDSLWVTKENFDSKNLDDFMQQNTLKFYEDNQLLPQEANIAINYYDYPPIRNFTISRTVNCFVRNDPHIWGPFLGNDYDYEFQRVGSYVLYKTDDLLIIAQFLQSGNPTLNCRLKFISYPGTTNLKKELTVFDFCGGSVPPKTPGNKCDVDESNKVKDVFNNYDWYITSQSRGGNYDGNFDCVKQNNHYYFMILFNLNNGYARSQTLVEISADDTIINSIRIFPSINATNHPNYAIEYNGGICGSTYTERDRMYNFWYGDIPNRVNITRIDYAGPSNEFANYWRSDKFDMQATKKKLKTRTCFLFVRKS